MPTRLADTRSMTMADAEADFAELAQATLRMERRAAMAEVRIAQIKDRLVADNAPDMARVKEAEARITQYVMTHRDEFERPRQHATDFGKFGLRTPPPRLQVADEETAIEALLDLGYDDCVQTVHKLDKPAVTKRIQAGELIPSCTVETGEVATYTVDRALVKQAREEAL